ncbi:hypothetical protein YC2023_089319 [Brassica napus]
MVIVRLCIHHPYQTGLFSLKRKDTKPIKSGYTLASYLIVSVTHYDRFLEINRQSHLQKFKIKYDKCNVYLFGISELIAEAINRGVHDLDIGTLKSPLTKDLMPVDIYMSNTLRMTHICLNLRSYV